jgi:hypothetical protein
MALTLWRGSTLLGELRERRPSPLRVRALHGTHPTLSAVLLARADAPLEGVSQIRVSPSRRGPVLQHAVPVDIVSERHGPRAPVDRASAAAALKALASEPLRGVPRERQFRVVGDAGDEIPIRGLRIQESRYEEKDFAVPLREVPPAALVNGSVWTVSVFFDAPARAAGWAFLALACAVAVALFVLARPG